MRKYKLTISRLDMDNSTVEAEADFTIPDLGTLPALEAMNSILKDMLAALPRLIVKVYSNAN